MSPILLVTELFPPVVGGSAILLGNVYGRLRDAEVTVMTSSVSSGRVEGVDTTFAIEPVAISGSHRGIRPWASARQHFGVTSAVRASLARRPVPVVHCARPLPEGLGVHAARFWPGQRPRYICWTHGEDLTAALTSREHAWLARRVCRGAEAIVASSHFTAAIVRSLGVPAERIPVIHPGVDPSRFANDGRAPASARPGAAPGSLTLLSVGRLQRRKGHDKVIEALAFVRQEWPGLRYRIAGTGEEHARLVALAHDRGVNDCVEFLGAVPDAALCGLYADSDVFIMPNRTDGHDVEGFGIVFLEAAAAERPSIGGRSGGAPEAIAEGETGLLVDGASVSEIAGAIRALASSPDRRRAMGKAGRERVLRQFTWDHAAARLRDLHLSLTEANRPSLAARSLAASGHAGPR